MHVPLGASLFLVPPTGAFWAGLAGAAAAAGAALTGATGSSERASNMFMDIFGGCCVDWLRSYGAIDSFRFQRFCNLAFSTPTGCMSTTMIPAESCSLGLYLSSTNTTTCHLCTSQVEAKMNGPTFWFCFSPLFFFLRKVPRGFF